MESLAYLDQIEYLFILSEAYSLASEKISNESRIDVTEGFGLRIRGGL